MKTTTPDVLYDGCGQRIDVMHPTRLFISLRGPTVGRGKADFHGYSCLADWAATRENRPASSGNAAGAVGSSSDTEGT